MNKFAALLAAGMLLSGCVYNSKVSTRAEQLQHHRFVLTSERDGYNHLYLYDRHTGKVKNQITKGEWYVREVLNVDEKKREITFTANGMVPNEDPYLVRYYRIRFDGSGLTCLTPEEGMHQAWFSDDKKYLVDVYSTVNKAPVAVLRNAANGKIVMPLEKADVSELQKIGWIAPEPFVGKGRDGKTDIWGIIYRPTNFDPTKKYPVIEFNTIYDSNCKYVIVGAFVTGIRESQDDGKLFKYWTTRYFDDADYKFDDWISEVRKRSWYSNDIECTADDKYISLSTCTNETSNLRWVIVAKKMTADDNLDLIIDSYKDKANKDIYFPKCWRNVYGNNKKYFGWDY